MYRKRIVKLKPNARFSTICLHAGQEPDPATGAIVTPIYQTSTYVQEALGRHKGYEYARTQNPTRAAVEGNLAAMESGRRRSLRVGHGAITPLGPCCDRAKSRCPCRTRVRGTFSSQPVLNRYELSFAYVDTGDLDAVKCFTPAPGCCSSRRQQPVMRLTDLRWLGPGQHEARSSSTTRSRALHSGRSSSGRTRHPAPRNI